MFNGYIIYALNIYSQGERNFRKFDDKDALLKVHEWDMLAGSSLPDFRGSGNHDNLIRLAQNDVHQRRFWLLVEGEQITLYRNVHELLSADIQRKDSVENRTIFRIVDSKGFEYRLYCLRPEIVHLYRQQ
jgi:hypothetical protein